MPSMKKAYRQTQRFSESATCHILRGDFLHLQHQKRFCDMFRLTQSLLSQFLRSCEKQRLRRLRQRFPCDFANLTQGLALMIALSQLFLRFLFGTLPSSQRKSADILKALLLLSGLR